MAEDEEHIRFWGKSAEKVIYGEECPFCHSRIDEFGFCACDAAGD
ncbi:MAG: hypothetical protein QXG05_04710 [Nitrososphaerota archaeon]